MSLQSRILHQSNSMYIGGQSVTSRQGQFIEVFDPSNGESVGRVPRGGRHEAELAVDAAHQACRGWSMLTAADRSEYLKRWANLIVDHAQELAFIVSAEQGKPLVEALDEVHGAAKFVEWYAEEGKRIYGETIPASAVNKRILVLRQAVGVSALITPWNYPASMITRKAAPALAAGCPVLVKPASQTPLTAVALFTLLHEAGFPPGVANLVTGNAGEIGQVFMEDARVRKVSFTGSTEVGKELIRASANQVKRLSLELGGNAPLIVFPDADLDAAVDGALGNKFENCGQMCNGINVLYVHEDVLPAFSERLVERVQAIRVGKGADPDVQMGPVIDLRSLEKIEELVEDAVRQGAKVLVGGRRITDGPYRAGTFYAPTVLVDVSNQMRVAQEEIFGPVAPLVAFRDEAEVLAKVNNTPYGLAAYLYTRDVRRVFEMAEDLEFGMVAVNSTSLSVPQAPFGGVKESGDGREGGHHGLDGFLSLKYISLSL